MVLVSYKPIVLGSLLVMVMHFLHAGQEHEALPSMDKHLTPLDFITALFDEVDAPRRPIPPPPHAHLWLREVGPLGWLPARKGGGPGRSTAG